MTVRSKVHLYVDYEIMQYYRDGYRIDIEYTLYNY